MVSFLYVITDRAHSKVNNRNISKHCLSKSWSRLEEEITPVKPYQDWKGCPIKLSTLHRLRIQGQYNSVWRAHQPGGRDLVAPLKVTSETHGSRISLFLPNSTHISPEIPQ